MATHHAGLIISPRLKTCSTLLCRDRLIGYRTLAPNVSFSPQSQNMQAEIYAKKLILFSTTHKYRLIEEKRRRRFRDRARKVIFPFSQSAIPFAQNFPYEYLKRKGSNKTPSPCFRMPPPYTPNLQEFICPVISAGGIFSLKESGKGPQKTD